MGAFKKSLFPLLMAAGLVGLFQNCGNNMTVHGNGDPYENLGSGNGGGANGLVTIPDGEEMIDDTGVLDPYVECNAKSSAQYIQTLYLAQNNGNHVLAVRMSPSITNRLILLPWTQGQSFSTYNRLLEGNVTLINVDMGASPTKAFISVSGSTMTESFDCHSGP